MRRLRRNLLRFAIIVSLALCAVSACMWVRSYVVMDWISRASVRAWVPPYMVRENIQAVSYRGVVSVGTSRMTGPVSIEPGWSWTRTKAEPPRFPPATLWNRLGFGWHRDAGPEPSLERVQKVTASGAGIMLGGWSLALPWWLVCAAAAILPTSRLIAYRRHRTDAARAGADARPAADR
jgi:hypothetical protein